MALIESFRHEALSIEAYIYDLKKSCFTQHTLNLIFEEMREVWNIAAYRRTSDFIKFLIKDAILIDLKKDLNKFYRLNSVTDFQFGQDLINDGYISYYSALKFHNLTMQLPKVIYVSWDRYGTE